MSSKSLISQVTVYLVFFRSKIKQYYNKGQYQEDIQKI